jgi:hypothetical protein
MVWMMDQASLQKTLSLIDQNIAALVKRAGQLDSNNNLTIRVLETFDYTIKVMRERIDSQTLQLAEQDKRIKELELYTRGMISRTPTMHSACAHPTSKLATDHGDMLFPSRVGCLQCESWLTQAETEHG